MKKENFPEELSLPTPQISKGLALLQSVSSRRSHGVENKQLEDQHRSSKSAQAINHYNSKVVRGWVEYLYIPSAATMELATPFLCQSTMGAVNQQILVHASWQSATPSPGGLRTAASGGAEPWLALPNFLSDL